MKWAMILCWLSVAAVTGFAPLAPGVGVTRGRGTGGCIPPLAIKHKHAGGFSCGAKRSRLRAKDDEVDFDAFRDLLNDSWATESAKSPDDGVSARRVVPSCVSLCILQCSP